MQWQNVSNPAAYGARWSIGTGAECELVSSRGSGRVSFGMRRDGRPWTVTSVTAPERFGALPIQSPRSWSAYVNAFLIAGSDEDGAQ